MGTLSDYFVASKTELKQVADSGRVPETFPHVQSKGFDVVPIGQLSKLFGVDDEGVKPGDPVCNGDDFEWYVLQVTPALVKALAVASDADVKKHGAAVAVIEELGWPTKHGREMVAALRELAQKAVATKKSMWRSALVDRGGGSRVRREREGSVDRAGRGSLGRARTDGDGDGACHQRR